MLQLRSDIWCASFVRRHNDLGNYCVVARKGHLAAGQVFIEVDHLNSTNSLYAPAPMLKRKDDNVGLVFELLLDRVDAKKIHKRIESELNFDPDIWVIALELRSEDIGLDIV